LRSHDRPAEIPAIIAAFFAEVPTVVATLLAEVAALLALLRRWRCSGGRAPRLLDLRLRTLGTLELRALLALFLALFLPLATEFLPLLLTLLAGLGPAALTPAFLRTCRSGGQNGRADQRCQNYLLHAFLRSPTKRRRSD
jgi:hypothetical protein